MLRAWIAWKPWLVVLAVVAAWQAADGIRDRCWPWHRHLSVAAGVFGLAVAASWSGAAPERYLRLLLALVVGVLVMLVSERELRTPGAAGRVLTAVFWSSAAMAATAVGLAFLSVGAFGERAIGWVNDIPGVVRVTAPAYRTEGIIAVTNWHEDPGYAAAWMTLWATLAVLAAMRGLGSRHAGVNALVVGGLWCGVVMTMSRTGWAGLVVAGVALLWRERSRLTALLRLASMSVAVTAVALGLVWMSDPPDVGGDLGTAVSFRLSQGFSLGSGEPDPDDPPPPDAGYVWDSRGTVWPIYRDAFVENPVRGIGLGTGWATSIQEPHNLVLELAGETGLVGLAGFAGLFVVIVRSAVAPVGRTALFVALVPAMTQTVLFEASWWFAAGLAVSAAMASVETARDG